MALFITFEGGEGCGKSVQTRALYKRLSQLAIPVLLTREPGGTPFGDRLGRWLKWGRDKDMLPLTELLLFNASRSQLVKEVIKPNLERGTIVICDRYTDSTTAYQSYGRGLDLALVKAVNSAAAQGLEPDMTVLLDMPVEAGLGRKKGKKRDRFEQEDIAFHQRVREGFLKLAVGNKNRWLVIDASQSRAKIREIIWQRVNPLLKRQGG